MKSNTSIAFSALCSFLILISSCHYSNQYHSINANNKFAVSLPDWMKEEKGLKEGADLQYANRFRNFYCIGEALSKAVTNKTSAEMMRDNLNVLRKSMPDAVVTDSTEINAGLIAGTRVEIYGKMNGEKIYFTEVIYEGEKNLYHVSIWTRSENRKLHFKPDIEKILSSFKEI